MTRLFIHIGKDHADQRVTDVVRKLENGQPVEPEEHITFETWGKFFETLTPNRIAILEHAMTQTPRSIKALAEALGRDYRNVHADVTTLRRAGLLAVTPHGITTDTEWHTATVSA